MTEISKRCQQYIGILLITIFIRLLFYTISKIIGPRITPLPCDTKDISFPFKKSTVPSLPFSIAMYVITILIIMITEYYKMDGIKKEFIDKGKKPRFQRKVFLFVILKIFVLNQIGQCIVFCILRVSKYSVGKLRPNFMDICKPNLMNIPCINGFYKSYQCNSTSTDDLIDARLSFFSGHTAYGFYFAIFIIMYMFIQRTSLKGKKLAYISTPLWIAVATLVGISRVTDYKHHILDVIIGFVVGTSVAIGIALYFEKKIKEEEQIFICNDTIDDKITFKAKNKQIC
uniref:AcidPPc domain-containing protein n=1 Tax=Parastrongyloides trichosuri TaxID=131310 RepID=A0A0N4ZC85_PARTI